MIASAEMHLVSQGAESFVLQAFSIPVEKVVGGKKK